MCLPELCEGAEEASVVDDDDTLAAPACIHSILTSMAECLDWAGRYQKLHIMIIMIVMKQNYCDIS